MSTLLFTKCLFCEEDFETRNRAQKFCNPFCRSQAEGTSDLNLWSAVRFGVFARDNFRCFYCGATPGKTKLEIDHVLPKVEGGEDSAENLVTACQECNRGKAAKIVNRMAFKGLWERAYETSSVALKELIGDWNKRK